MKKISYPTAVTIGIFDGVHKGHQKILERLVKEAKRYGLKSVAITFDPHPVDVLSGGGKIPFLMSLEHRVRLIKEAGVDYCFVERFTKRFSKLSPEGFIKILADRLNMKLLVTGGNFLFGSKEKGDTTLLKKLSGIYGFKLYAVPPMKMNGGYISSTRIRRLIERGELKKASDMLARPVTILGTVVKGKRLGRKIGFPTANIDPHHEAIPSAGVYNVGVRLGKASYRGILNIDTHKVIEVYIFHFKKDIYGRDIEVVFGRKIRNEKKFKTLEALKKQIQLDILQTVS
ncbi:MAG: bifunctional riboflavin kinase/FAD synthetase [Candidatus Omnitrophota bacterium]|jgi:riboflavin kinase/FMN adenylyltransferase